MRLTLLSILIALYLPLPSFAQDRDMATLSWLAGSWNRFKAGPMKQGVEHWSLDKNELTGYGLTTKQSDTLFLEQLRIVRKKGIPYYMADVKENPASTYFKFTHISSNSFTCENRQHDFPKKIVYRLVGDTLTAIISGNGKEVSFLFTKS